MLEVIYIQRRNQDICFEQGRETDSRSCDLAASLTCSQDAFKEEGGKFSRGF